MALQRTSTAVWHGTGPRGSGTITTLSGAIENQPYAASSRFTSEDGKAGTNPEELIAAAHSSCFTMALAFQLTNAGLDPSELRTVATVHLEKLDSGWTLTEIQLAVEGKVPNVSPEKFALLADAARTGCPISRALAATPMSLTAKLVS